MSKLDNIKKKYETAQADANQLREDIEKIKKEYLTIGTEAEKLAEKGDADGYRDALNKIKDLEIMQHVKESRLNYIKAPVSADEAREAWTEYMKAAGAKVNKGLEAYRKAREDYFNKMLALFVSYNDILRARECCALCSTGDPEAATKFKITTPLTRESFANELKYFAKYHPEEVRRCGDIGAMLFTQKSTSAI